MRASISTVAVVVAAGLSMTASAGAQSFAVKPGAWDITSTMSAGATLPPDALAKLSPEQRAAVEKRLAEGGARTRRTCVRQEDLDQDRFMKRQDSNCTAKTVSRTSSRLVVALTCSAPAPATGSMTFEAKTPESVVGTIDLQSGGNPALHIGIVGRWLGSRCEGIEPTSRN